MVSFIITIIKRGGSKSASPKRSGTPKFISILFFILFTDGYQSFSGVGSPSFLASPMSFFGGGG